VEQQHLGGADAPVGHRRRVVQVLQAPRHVQRDARALRPARRWPAAGAGRLSCWAPLPRRRPCACSNRCGMVVVPSLIWIHRSGEIKDKLS
jgi:hypothetical protein